MHTPAHNPNGYDNTSITDMTALQQTVRFLVIHGASDDNVHIQNTLVLVDKLDLAGVQNYDLHFYPDSDHSINFHNAHRMVYEREPPFPSPIPWMSSTGGIETCTDDIDNRTIELARQRFQR